MENTLVWETKDPALPAPPEPSPELSPRDPKTLGKVNTFSLKGNG